MAKVFFEPLCAVKYTGSKAKEFLYSLARPKPFLKKGDIVIVSRKDSFNLVSKGHGEFVSVDKIEFVKADTQASQTISELKEQIKTLEDLSTNQNDEDLRAINNKLQKEVIRLEFLASKEK